MSARTHSPGWKPGGLAYLRFDRQLPRTCHCARTDSLPVILATGYAELPAGKQARTQILQKPFSLEDLARILKR